MTFLCFSSKPVFGKSSWPLTALHLWQVFLLVGLLEFGVVCAQPGEALDEAQLAPIAVLGAPGPLAGADLDGGLKLRMLDELRTVPEDVVPLLPGSQVDLDRISVSRSGANIRLSRPALLAVLSNMEQATSAQAGPGIALDELLALAVQGHPEIASKRAELDVAKANQDGARWQYFPTPSLQVSQDKGSNAVVAAVQQPVWSGGRLDASYDAAVSRVRSAEVSIREAQYSLALRVTGAWQSWKQAHGRAEAFKRGIGLLKNYAESVRRRVDGGVSPEVDRELVESRIAQSEGDLAVARAAERSAMSQLSEFLGRPLKAGDLFSGNVVSGTLPAFETLIERSIGSSVVMRRIEEEIEAARHDVTQKRAALWPTIGVRAQYQLSNNGGGSAADNRVMLVMDYVPGAGLSASSGIDAAAARVVNLRETREAARREMTAKVSADYEDHLSNLGRKRGIQRSIQASTEVLASYDRLFVAGKRNWLDVLNAARELTQVEVSLADVEAAIAASYFRLRLHGNELPWQRGEES